MRKFGQQALARLLENPVSPSGVLLSLTDLLADESRLIRKGENQHAWTSENSRLLNIESRTRTVTRLAPIRGIRKFAPR